MHDPDKERQDGDTGFARWSRRKAAARTRTANASTARDESSTSAPVETERAPESHQVSVTAGEPATEVLPDPEHMDGSADFSVFLRDGIAPALRRAALRRLWTLDPVFSYQDGLVEYGEDFTDTAKAGLSVRMVCRVASDFAQDAIENAEPNFQSNASTRRPSGESAVTNDSKSTQQDAASAGSEEGRESLREG